jgi:diguanylate cyclase (GGDEF)-like protein
MAQIDLKQLNIAGRMPSPSGVALKIFELTRRDETTIVEISRVLQTDPSLSGEMLRFANCGRFAGLRPTASIGEAVARIGTAALRQAALAVSLLYSNRSGECPAFDYTRFWSHSLAIAVSARRIAATIRVASPEECFTAGLLSRIGLLAMTTLFPENYARLLSESDGLDALELRERERAQFGFCSNELTETMLKDWGLPPIYVDIMTHREPKPEQERQQGLIDMMDLADHIADMCLATESERYDLLPPLYRLGARVGMDEADLGRLVRDITEEWEEWGRIYKVPTQKMPALEDMLAVTQGVFSSAIADDTVAEPLQVLVVDDEPTSQTILQTLVAAAGHDATVVADGQQALSHIVSNGPPDIVITDWRMPNLDGIELCRALRQSQFGNSLYIIILTAYGDEDVLVEAFAAGADDYMTKPINRREFDARVRSARRVVRLHRRLIGDMNELRRSNAELVATNKTLQSQALTDFLTGLPNRRYFIERTAEALAGAARNARPLSMLYLDLDDFKRLNDELGHDQGDEALRSVAEIFRREVRAGETLARLGGEEFALLCPGADEAEAVRIAERLRAAVEHAHIKRGQTGECLTVSVGVAVNDKAVAEPDELMRRADSALYEAKGQGRNRVCTYGKNSST